MHQHNLFPNKPTRKPKKKETWCKQHKDRLKVTAKISWQELVEKIRNLSPVKLMIVQRTLSKENLLGTYRLWSKTNLAQTWVHKSLGSMEVYWHYYVCGEKDIVCKRHCFHKVIKRVEFRLWIFNWYGNCKIIEKIDFKRENEFFICNWKNQFWMTLCTIACVTEFPQISHGITWMGDFKVTTQ